MLIDPDEPRWAGVSDGKEIRSHEIAFEGGETYLWNEARGATKGPPGFWVKVTHPVDRFADAVIRKHASA